MSKFVGKFRKNRDYNDDYEYSRSANKKRVKHKVKEHAEVKKKMRQWQNEKYQDFEQ